jgi:predicted DNA-binding transcriptional regulator AlpA
MRKPSDRPRRAPSFIDLTDTPINPRLLNKKEAAAYCGVSTGTFGKWVKAGIMPSQVSITRMWDRRAIDAALDALSNLTNVGKENS